MNDVFSMTRFAPRLPSSDELRAQAAASGKSGFRAAWTGEWIKWDDLIRAAEDREAKERAP